VKGFGPCGGDQRDCARVLGQSASDDRIGLTNFWNRGVVMEGWRCQMVVAVWAMASALAVHGSGGETRAAGRRKWWRGLARTAGGGGIGNLPSPHV
jgi:hypothetical protein